MPDLFSRDRRLSLQRGQYALNAVMRDVPPEATPAGGAWVEVQDNANLSSCSSVDERPMPNLLTVHFGLNWSTVDSEGSTQDIAHRIASYVQDEVIDDLM